ncbi:hypothetical protein [Streptomyces sp. NPDC059262]|uniref:hypothetical protein n=1 Tax=Streptomyces sp. NPDC059262 TaxID=3346797 RepID=UPI00369E574B
MDGIEGVYVGGVRKGLGPLVEVLVVAAPPGLPDPARERAGVREQPMSFRAWKMSALTFCAPSSLSATATAAALP